MRNLLGDAPASRFLVQVIGVDLIRPKDLASQKIRRRRRHPLWNTSILLLSVLTNRQLSDGTGEQTLHCCCIGAYLF